MHPGIAVGADGLARCAWSVASADYTTYHDDEWGRPVRGDAEVFERISLEAFQSGLSWLTILRKREAFRTAFAGFRPVDVAAFDERDIDRLMGDPGIVRNRRKIVATIGNARAILAFLDAAGPGALDAMFWSFAPRVRTPLAAGTPVPASTDESRALSDSLKRMGLTWVGPTTMYAAMQACGLVDDHVAGCLRSTASSAQITEVPAGDGP